MFEERWHGRHREGVRLWCLDVGAMEAPPVVLLHGLAGYAAEWAETASWLAHGHRVVAPEQRGHGRSERAPDDVSRTAFVEDVEMWLEELGLAQAVVVGQSLGGHTAFLLAARRPDLVRGLIVAEATPEADPDAPEVVRRWLESWPVPFASDTDAAGFFGGESLRARTWADGLERRGDGLWPAFDDEVMIAALADVSVASYWDEWRRVRCPTLLVRAAGVEGRDVYERMIAEAPSASLVEIADAGHDVHLDRPDLWREQLTTFLDKLGPLDRL
jgi:pimeloyl-ACP methyl ester carboxylesterase